MVGTSRRRRALACAVVATGALLGSTAVALSDGPYGDGNGDTVFAPTGDASNNVSFGDVCTGETVTRDFPLKLARIGTSPTVIYKNGSTATFTTSVTTAQTGLSVGMVGQNTIPVPADWESAATTPPRMTADQVLGRVTLVAGDAPRTVNGAVRFLGGGTNAANSTFTRNLNSTVTANVVECNEAPELTVPADMTVEETQPGGAVVDYETSASDAEDGDLSAEVECDPPSGSLFPVGTTTVTCSVEDSGGKSDSDSFDVTVVEACDPALDPVGCWRFNESGGTTAFDFTNANNGTYTGGPVLGVPGALMGNPDTAVSMDGVNDHVVVPDSDSLDVEDSFTLEGWILRDNDNKTHQLFNKGGMGFHLVVMDRFNGNQVWLRKAGKSTIVRSLGGVPADGAYHHVVATKDGPNSARIYIDGVQQALQVVSGVQVIENTAARLFFSATSAGDVVAGDLDEYAVYDRALTLAEVEDRFDRGTDSQPPVTSSAAADAPEDLPGGDPAGAGRCTDILAKGVGIDEFTVTGIGCAPAEEIVLGGPDALKAAGFDCRITSEEFGTTVKIRRDCNNAAKAQRISYLTLS